MVKVHFKFPRFVGMYVVNYDEIYLFGADLKENEIVDALSHEITHAIIHKVLCQEKTHCNFDELGETMKKWDKSAYRILFGRRVLD